MKKTLALMGAVSVLAIAGAAQAGTINGTVTNGSGAYPLAAAEVTVVETGRTVVTARDGSFRLAGLPAGTYNLTISYVGAPSETVTVTLDSDDDTQMLNVALGEELDDTIVVIGQRGALNSALNQQRNADGVISVLSSDAVGQLPDENVAEAARRAVGVNVLNDQGEGRFVSIRGLDPNLVSTSVDGISLPSPEADARQVPLDVIDADLLKNIIITKTLTPDMDADSIGGNVEIETLSGLDQKDMLFKAKIGTVYSSLQEEYGEKASLTFADNFIDGKLGLAASVAWQNRPFGSENLENDGDWVFEDDIAYPEELEMRDYFVTRKRLSAAVNLDYQLDDLNLFFVRYLYSDFEDQEYRSRIENKFGDPEFIASGGNSAVFDAGADDPFEVDRDLKDRKETQNISAISAGGEHIFNLTEIDWTVSYSHAEEKEPERFDTGFRAEFEEGFFGVNVYDANKPQLYFPDASAEAEYFDPDNYEFDALERTNGLTEDEEYAAELNIRRDVNFGSYPGYIKFGGKMRQREKGYDLDLEIYEADDLVLSDFMTTVDYGLGPINPTVDASIGDFFFANRALFELQEIDTLIESNVENYGANEDVYAAYLMGKIDIDALRVIGGVRVEQTEFDAWGNSVFLAEEDAIVDGVELTDDTVFIEELRAEDSYTDVLPSVNARYEFTPELIGRAGYYASVIRPKISAITPSVAIEQNDDNEVEAELGNPDLQRQKADNLDFTLEYYPDNKSVISAGVFFKQIDDYIATTFVSGDLPDDAADLVGVPFVENYDLSAVEEFDFAYGINLDDAELWGFELNYQQALDYLPAPFDGFIVGANYTYVDGEANYEGETIRLPKQSENIANLIVGYDKGIFDLRLAATYRDEYLDELGDDWDRVIDSHMQLDFSGKVEITDQFKYYLDVKNITDEPFVAVARYKDGEGDYLSQYEEYGWSVQTGFTFQY